jgi:hypothetical protein
LLRDGRAPSLKRPGGVLFSRLPSRFCWGEWIAGGGSGEARASERRDDARGQAGRASRRTAGRLQADAGTRSEPGALAAGRSAGGHGARNRTRAREKRCQRVDIFSRAARRHQGCPTGRGRAHIGRAPLPRRIASTGTRRPGRAIRTTRGQARRMGARCLMRGTRRRQLPAPRALRLFRSLRWVKCRLAALRYLSFCAGAFSNVARTRPRRARSSLSVNAWG